MVQILTELQAACIQVCRIVRSPRDHVVETLLLLLLDYPLESLQALGRLVRPLLELLVEDLLVLVLDHIIISLVILRNNPESHRLERRLKELGQAVIVRLVVLQVDREVPVDDVQEYLLEPVQFFDLDEAAARSEEVVRVEDIRVEFLGYQGRCQD